MSAENSLEGLDHQLELFIENIRQIGIIVSDFQEQGQPVLNQKIQTLISDLQKIDKQRSKVEDIHIPLAVFDYIDNNKNPQLYTKDCIEKALNANEETRGKIDQYRKFKYNLTSELQKEFPGEINKYRAIRKDE